MNHLSFLLLFASFQAALLNVLAVVGFLLLCAKKTNSKKSKKKQKKSSAEPIPPASVSTVASIAPPKQADAPREEIKSVEQSVIVEKKSGQNLATAEEDDKPANNKDAHENKSERKDLPDEEIIGKSVKDKLNSVASDVSHKSTYLPQELKKVTNNREDSKQLSGDSTAVVPLTGMELEPKELRFTGNGGQTKLNLENKTGNRVAIKMKCSDNALYHLSPVYQFIDRDGKASVEITRAIGAVKPDKLEVVFAEASDELIDAQEVFKSAAANTKFASTSVPVFVYH